MSGFLECSSRGDMTTEETLWDLTGNFPLSPNKQTSQFDLV